MAGRYLLMEGDILDYEDNPLTIRLIMKVMDILNQYFLFIPSIGISEIIKSKSIFSELG